MMEQTKAIIQAICVLLANHVRSSCPIFSHDRDRYGCQRKGIAKDVAHAELLAIVVPF